MTTFNLANIMDGIATMLTNGNVASQVFAYPPAQFNPPCAIVGYPIDLDFDVTFKRGTDRAVFPVWLVAGNVVESSTRGVISGIIDGATGVKTALEASGGTLNGTVSNCQVVDCRIESISQPGGTGTIEYMAARFRVEVMT